MKHSTLLSSTVFSIRIHDDPTNYTTDQTDLVSRRFCFVIAHPNLFLDIR